MKTARYSAEEVARRAGIPVCLVDYYAHIGLLGVQEAPQTLPMGLELVDSDMFIQEAAVAGFNHEEMACLLELNEGADSRALRLAANKMAELMKRQRSITRLQAHLEAWLYEYCGKPEARCFINDKTL